LVLTDKVTDTSQTLHIGFFPFEHLVEEFLGHVIDLRLLGRKRFENCVAVSDSGNFNFAQSLTIDRERERVSELRK